jgi:hypothetical protein
MSVSTNLVWRRPISIAWRLHGFLLSCVQGWRWRRLALMKHAKLRWRNGGSWIGFDRHWTFWRSFWKKQRTSEEEGSEVWTEGGTILGNEENRTDRKEVDQASKKAVVSGRRVRWFWRHKNLKRKELCSSELRLCLGFPLRLIGS